MGWKEQGWRVSPCHCLQEGAAFGWQCHHPFCTLHVRSQSWQRNNIALTLIQLCVGAVWSHHGRCYGVSVVLCIHRPLGLWFSLFPLLCGACFSAHLHCAASAHLKPRDWDVALVLGRESWIFQGFLALVEHVMGGTWCQQSQSFHWSQCRTYLSLAKPDEVQQSLPALFLCCAQELPASPGHGSACAVQHLSWQISWSSAASTFGHSTLYLQLHCGWFTAYSWDPVTFPLGPDFIRYQHQKLSHLKKFLTPCSVCWFPPHNCLSPQFAEGSWLWGWVTSCICHLALYQFSLK